MAHKNAYNLPYGSVTILEVREKVEVEEKLDVQKKIERKEKIEVQEKIERKEKLEVQEKIDIKEILDVKEIGKNVFPVLQEHLCEEMLSAVNVPKEVISHCRMTAKEANRIAEELILAGKRLDQKRIVCGAWLHDIAKMQKSHAKTGAKWLSNLGYKEIAAEILYHNDMESDHEIDEAAVVYIADKCVLGDRLVSVEQRFESSLGKCHGQEAFEAHQRRFHTAWEIKERINSICGKEIIK